MNKHIKQAQYKKGFANVILILVIIVVGAAGYFALVRKPAKITDNQTSQTQEETTQSPSITVISPNGGEKWEVGRSYEIRWNFYGILSTANVFVRFTADNLRYVKSFETVNDGEELFTITPDMLATNDYRIDVSHLYGFGPDCPTDSMEVSLPGCIAGDYSDAPFSIVQ
ncbi:MAG: hypothetical protein AAB890_00390 [Patescibacteria group bacterium]